MTVVVSRIRRYPRYWLAVEAFEVSSRKLAGLAGRTITAVDTMAVLRTAPVEAITLSDHVEAPGEVGASVRRAFAGNVPVWPSIVHVPPRPVIVAGLAGVAANPVITRTRTT